MSVISHLLEAEIPRLRRYARSLLRNSSSVEDLVQDTLLRALEKAHLWQPDTNLRAWMFTMMHNQYVNSVRLSVRRGTEVMAENAGLSAPATQNTALEFRDLQRALRSLPAEQRDVVLMICIEGMSYEEVAEILVIPIGTVRSRLSRARDQIRLLMDGGPAKSKDGAGAMPSSIGPRARRDKRNRMNPVPDPLGVATSRVLAVA